MQRDAIFQPYGVYVSPDAMASLKTCLTYRPTQVPGTAGFWNQKRPQRPLSSTAVQKKMERYAQAAGITASCHSLRHTFASNLLEQGTESVVIKAFLGRRCFKAVDLLSCMGV